MSSRTFQLPDPLQRYVWDRTLREPEILRRLREETAQRPDAEMQISPEQGQFMGLLAEMLEVRLAIEVGTYTGYSALVVALAMPRDGRLIACDINHETSAVARRYWELAGVNDRIELRLGSGQATMNDFERDPGICGRVDLIFLDADKENYPAYYDSAIRLLRRGGVVALDNAFWDGAVADPSLNDEETSAIRAVTQRIHADERVTCSLVPIGDGLLLARKR